MTRIGNIAWPIFIVLAVAWIRLFSYHDFPSAFQRPTRQGIASVSTPTPADCSRKQYVSSTWEVEWITNADSLYARDAICPTMQASGDLADQWLASVTACKDANTTCWLTLPERVFSKFVKECRQAGTTMYHGRGIVVEEYIEPLVGHMRHPHALKACKPSSRRGAHVTDKNYLMLLGDDHAAVRARHPGRALLFDAGANMYATSLGYLIPTYAKAGIHFDAIYAWETTPANASQYWDSVPDDVRSRLHFYNAPVTPQPGSAMNPVDWIRDMYRPGDYIVFKLDIDNDAVESQLIQQVLDWDGAEDAIAEMFFEKHYSAADMKIYFGSPPTQYPAALRLMHKLRTKGVRAHYWP